MRELEQTRIELHAQLKDQYLFERLETELKKQIDDVKIESLKAVEALIFYKEIHELVFDCDFDSSSL